jgi:nicotinamidase-related amidase
VAVIYANDNHGQWRSDFRHVVASSLSEGGAGARITRILSPQEDDYFVLKPRHSAFFATPLELLLEHLQTKTLIVVGVTADQCVLNTVADGRIRNFEVVVPADCVAALTPARKRRALAHFHEALEVRTPSSRAVRLRSIKS